VLISLRLEKRSLVMLPPLVIQLAPASSFSSSDVNAGASAIPSDSAVSAGSFSVSAGAVSSVVVVELLLLLPPPQPAITRAPNKARREMRTNPLRRHPLPIEFFLLLLIRSVTKTRIRV